MAKKYQDMDIAEKIEVKKRKIKKLFKELPSDKAQFADGLIAQFAVTSVTLERLADEINGGELIEDFVQGSQSMRRESPALRSYNTTIGLKFLTIRQIGARESQRALCHGKTALWSCSQTTFGTRRNCWPL